MKQTRIDRAAEIGLQKIEQGKALQVDQAGRHRMNTLSTLHCQKLGQGPAVILLHGLFGMGDNLMPLARSLADKHVVLAPDLRNHGRSLHSKTMSWSLLVEDVIHLMSASDIEAAALVGHSLGGKVAMAVADRYPERVSALVVADIAPVTYPPRHQPVFAGLRAVDLPALTSRQQADKTLEEYDIPLMVRQFLLKSLWRQSDGVYDWRFNLSALQEGYDQLRSMPVLRGVYRGATLFIKGSESDYILPEHQGAIESVFPQAQYKIIQGAGHWLHAEKPIAFAKLVTQFLERSLQS